MSAGISSVQPMTVPEPRLSSSACSFSSWPQTVMGWNSPDRPIASTVARTSPTPHEPATTSTARSSGARPSALRTAARSMRASRKLLAHQRPVCTRVLAAACRRRLGRQLADGKMTVDAGVHPERVDREVGEEGHDRNAERLRAAHASEHERRERVHRHDRVGTELLDRLPQLPPRQPRVDHDRRRAEEWRESVVELVAPREVPELNLVEPTEHGSDVERDRVEEVDDFDSVAASLEPPVKLLGRAVMPRAHRRRDDQNAPTHGPAAYRVGARRAGYPPAARAKACRAWRGREARD